MENKYPLTGETYASALGEILGLDPTARKRKLNSFWNICSEENCPLCGKTAIFVFLSDWQFSLPGPSSSSIRKDISDLRRQKFLKTTS
jgi:hypothetical protein